MVYAYFLIILIFLVANTRRQLSHGFWWQVKEYRIDRMRVFLGTREGRGRMELHFLALKILSLILFFPGFLGIYFITVLFECLLFLKEIIFRQVRKPELSTRGKNFLKTSSLFLLLSSVLLYKYPAITVFIFLDLVSYFVPVLALFWTQILFDKALSNETKKAKKILSEVKPKIIGITGSQGKSSTKHLLNHILSTHFNTLETPLSHNTPFGIVRTINNSLNKNHKFFLSEMGAYKRQEIAKLTKITPPDIAMITGISPQHVALFGSIDKLMDAKYEIAQDLDSNHPLFLNTSKSSTNPIYKRAKAENKLIITYALSRIADYSGVIKTRNKNSTVVNLKTPKTKRTFTTNLTFDHLIENLVGAIAVADYLGIPWAKITKAVKSIPHFERAIEITEIKKGLTLINDSYNSTPDGFAAAIKELNKFSEKKLVVTAGIPELGKNEREVHTDLAKKMKGIDTLLLLTPELEGAFLDGVNGTKVILTSAMSFKRDLFNNLDSKSVILAEGRLPSKVMKDLANL